jgi:hypothetical protein
MKAQDDFRGRGLGGHGLFLYHHGELIGEIKCGDGSNPGHVPS